MTADNTHHGSQSVEHRLALLERTADQDIAAQWVRVAAVYDLLIGLRPRTAEYRAMRRAISERGRMRTRMQQYCLQVGRACISPDGEWVAPLRLSFTAARVIVTHGGGYDEIATADSEGWTLAQARAWAQGRAATRERTPRLWAHVTKAVPRALRTLDGPPSDEQVGELVRQVRDAARAFGREKAAANP